MVINKLSFLMEIDSLSISDDKIRNFSFFKNPNNFDDYYSKVLPESKINLNFFFLVNFNYIYVSKEPKSSKKFNIKRNFSKCKSTKRKNSFYKLSNPFKKKKINFLLKKRRKSFHIVTYKTQLDQKKFEKKEELMQKNFEDEKNFENNKKMLNCPKCNWNFPKNMNLKRIDIHINKCLDGFGEEDKLRYESYRKYNKLTLREIDIYIYCPICNKNLSKIRNPKIKYCHVQECLKRLNKKDFGKKESNFENNYKKSCDVNIEHFTY